MINNIIQRLAIVLLLLSFIMGQSIGQTVSGNLLTGSDGTYDRIFTGDVDPGCNAMSTFSGSGINIPYVAIDFYPTSTGPLDVNVVTANTDLNDSVISLYCDFDPNDASTGLVAYDDDGGGGLLSALISTDGAIVTENQKYTLVISVFSPTGVGGGAFEVSFNTPSVTFTNPNTAAIPTLGEWGLVLLALSLFISGIVYMKHCSFKMNASEG